jgi:hypothetical protein
LDGLTGCSGRPGEGKKELFKLDIIADAIISEVVSLHIYLETLAKRQEILKGYIERSMRAAGPGK